MTHLGMLNESSLTFLLALFPTLLGEGEFLLFVDHGPNQYAFRLDVHCQRS